MRINFQLILGVSFLMFLAGCKPPAPHPPNNLPQILPSRTAYPTSSPTGITTLTLQVPSLPAANTPRTITPQNAADVAQSARFGGGMVNSAPFYSMDGEMLVVPTTIGIDLYEASTLIRLSSIPQLFDGGATLIPAYPRLAALSPDHRFLATNLRAVAFSPSGGLQEESIQQNIYLWDIAAETTVWKIPIGPETILADLAFSPDGKSLAAGFDAGKVQLWHVADGAELFSFKGSELEFSPDGNTLASMPPVNSSDHQVYVYSLKDGRLLRQWKGQRAIFSPFGLLAVESDGAVRVMDIDKGIALHAFNGKSASFSADGQSLALLDQDQVKLYQVVDGSLLEALEGRFKAVSKMEFAPDGQTLAIVGDVAMCPNCLTAPLAAFWKVSDGALVKLGVQDPLGLTYAPHEGYLVIWTVTSIYILNPANVSPVVVFNEYVPGIDGIAFSPDGNTLAVNNGHPHLSVRLWQVVEGRPDKLLETPQNPGYGYSKVLFSPDSQILSAQGNFWNLTDGKPLSHLMNKMEKEAPPYVPASIAFSPDGSILAIGYLEGHLQLWDLREEKLIRKLEGYQGEVVDLAFSPDGKTLAAVYAYPDTTIQLWKISEGLRSTGIKGTEWTHVFSQAGFSPDGQTLVSVAKNEDGMDLGII